MTQLQLATQLVRTATLAVELKHRSARGDLRRAVAKELVRKQYEATGKDLARALAPLFVEQVRSIAKGLAKLGEGKSASDAASNLVAQVFDPQEWRKRLVDLALPVLARKMAQAGVAQLMLLGIDVRRKRVKRVVGGPTTASDWVEEHSADWQRLVEAFEASGEPLGIIADIPDWMRRSIAEQLTATFERPYWDKISATTQGDAERFMRQGFDEGWSIPKIAREMRDHFLPAAEEGVAFDQATRRYATRRGERIARTEGGHVLNAARRASMDELIGEVGPQVPMRPAWLSVLGNTTRDTHANLDGVPADADGMWELGGVRVPWPAHIDLDVGERANCQCSLYMEFGMDEEEARRLIGEHEARVREGEEVVAGEVERPETPAPLPFPQPSKPPAVAPPSLAIAPPMPEPAAAPPDLDRQAIDALLEAKAQEIRELRHERLVLLNRDGSVHSMIDGKQDRVSVTLEQARAMQGKVTLHNHPGGATSFSGSDIYGAINRGELETHIVTSRGQRFSMSYPGMEQLSKKERWKLADEVKADYAKEVREQAKKYVASIRSGAIAFTEDAPLRLEDAAWKAVAARHGLAYKGL